MNEKINKIINNEKLRGFCRKLFTKKKIGGALAAIVIIAGVNVGYSLAFEVKGTVMKVDSKSISVRNFLGTKTVNLGDYPVSSNNIVVGERIEIKKNISGEVIDIRTGNGRGGREGDRSFAQDGRGRMLGQNRGQDRNGKSGFGQGKKIPGKNGQQGADSQQGSNNQQAPNGQQGAAEQQAPNGQGTQPSAPAEAPANNQ